MKDMLSKKEVLKSLKDLPDEFPVDEAIDRLIVLHKMTRGRMEIRQGKGLTTEDAKKKLKKWLS
ncbi:MAG TPA: hypothetical protein VF487_00835 [Chitinophagaceae bacterium]